MPRPPVPDDVSATVPGLSDGERVYRTAAGDLVKVISAFAEDEGQADGDLVIHQWAVPVDAEGFETGPRRPRPLTLKPGADVVAEIEMARHAAVFEAAAMTAGQRAVKATTGVALVKRDRDGRIIPPAPKLKPN